ncbi:DUF6265 family protein [Maribacter sp. TH_r10]|uniref:DUF6265 domain-containing protein n=1 Tax=Maribacter luteus TaxID=2594478 RepID=A0A6I2MK00_9FLAO|nr:MULTISPECIES: DUF6265 family protein [Maribacter]MDV7137375.1 DUF6265 family protein [Maribacter sp. TH_r10]MRX64103.1 hypothetical protein [Maribacter luteus]
MKLSTILLLCFSVSCFAQNTMSFSDNDIPPKATLEDVSWVTGHWKGEAFGGIAEEIWSPPLGDSMMFVFKLVTEGKVQFYEVGHIQQRDETLILQLKHFHGSLKGWEEKDETVDFKLVKLEGDKIYFDDFTIERISENEINMYVVVGDEDGSSKEVKFNYKREQ